MVLSPAAHPGTCSSAPLQGPCPPVPTCHRPSFQIAHPRVNPPLRVEVRREYPKPRQGKPEAAGEEMGRVGRRGGVGGGYEQRQIIWPTDAMCVLLVSTHSGRGNRAPPTPGPNLAFLLQVPTVEGGISTGCSLRTQERGWGPTCSCPARHGGQGLCHLRVHYRGQPSAVGSRRRAGPGRRGSARGRASSKG